MTQMLKRAFDEASQRPETLQDAIAALVLAELASEQRWDESFARSQDALAALAEEALAEHQAVSIARNQLPALVHAACAPSKGARREERQERQ